MFCAKISNAGETTQIIATEITYSKESYTFKFRPFYYYLKEKIQRVDLMIGKEFGNFALSGYMKSDTENRSWMGIKGEIGRNIHNEHFGVKLELRYFAGLNKKAKDHYYFLPSAAYRTGRFKIGVLGYGKGNIGETARMYLSPLIGAELINHVSVILFFGPDVLNNFEKNLLYFRTNFDF